MSLKIHPGEYYVYPEDDMPESQAQIDLVEYLTAVLKYLYAMQPYFVTGNLTVVPPNESFPFQQIVPDIMVIEGMTFNEEERLTLNSWNMKQPNRPAPMTVFEVSSEKTWRNDLNPKPEHYRLLGVQEYFAYDPQSYWPNTTRLRGWRYANGQTQEILPQPGQNRLWSETLQSWLEPAGGRLRLIDSAGNVRLTGEEALSLAQQTERQAKEAALHQAETERAALQELLEKLRRKNIDPDTL